MTRYLTKAGILIVVAMVAGVLVAPPVWPTMYQCVDASGVKVFSDSAAQLHNCTVVNMTVGSAPAPSAPSRSPSSFGELEMGGGPGSVPDALAPQASASDPAIPDFAAGLQAVPWPGAEHNPAAAPPPGSQPCVPAVNPFNPFAGPPCPSLGGAALPSGVPAPGALPVPQPE